MLPFKLLITLLCLTLTTCTLVGSTRVQNSIPKDDQFRAVDEFARREIPELGQALILSVATQMVSGMNYKIVYEKLNGEQIEVVVYNQPWTRTTRILRASRIV